MFVRLSLQSSQQEKVSGGLKCFPVGGTFGSLPLLFPSPTSLSLVPLIQQMQDLCKWERVVKTNEQTE